ncbi:type I-F CRISPR-associated protein Cas7f/Csy3 [Rhodopirellula europaea]|uniref:type I-F CRISPR-associated protein Cas7f/Csy3 n=1 Tax=Rhodopirellula europaea TaxID=1263866 RepID=UPI003D2BCC01
MSKPSRPSSRRVFPGQREFSLFEITATAQLGGGQEVYPSEELVTEKGDKGRVLYSVDSVAAMHSQKLGNAIRTIDTWYQDDAPRPIAVEVYGSVTNLGIAYRKPTAKNDFYSLFDAFGQGLEINEDQRHYVMAMLAFAVACLACQQSEREQNMSLNLHYQELTCLPDEGISVGFLMGASDEPNPFGAW